ncbi:hypothetical protein E0494_05230 [Marinilabiliaceae bacterium JC040]|nr:hypothetical protein [Marinilabiliaceae bacterium JC040]
MKKSTTNIQFRLFQVITKQFAIINENHNSNLDVGYNLDTEFKIDESNNIISCLIDLFLLSEDNIFLKLGIEVNFLIEEKSWNDLKQKKKIIFPKLFAEHLNFLSLGTLRGVLHAKTENLDMNKYVLPLIDVSDYIKEDLCFDI